MDLRGFGLAFKVQKAGSQLALIDLDDSKGMEIITNLNDPEAENNLVAIDGRGKIIDTVNGCRFESIILSDGRPLIMVSKYIGSRIEEAPDSGPSELLDWNLRSARFERPFELTTNHKRNVHLSKQLLFIIENGKFKEHVSLDKPVIGHPYPVKLEEEGYTIIEMKGPGSQDSDKLSQLLKRKIHNRSQANFIPVRVQDYMKNLRSVWLFESIYSSSRISYPTAIGCHPMATDDLTGDGFKEIILGGYSPENSVSINNFTDYGQGYVFALDKRANLLWRYERPGNFPRYRASVLQAGKGQEKIVIGVASTYFDSFGEVVAIDGKTGTVRAKKKAGHSFLGLVLFDSDNDGEEEIYTGSSVGDVLHLNKDLKILDEYRAKGAGFQTGRQSKGPGMQKAVAVLAANDINGDGNVEIIGLEVEYSRINLLANGKDLMIYEYNLLVFSSNLEFLARIKIMESLQNGCIDTNLMYPTLKNAIGDITGNGINEIIVIINETMYIIGHI